MIVNNVRYNSGLRSIHVAGKKADQFSLEGASTTASDSNGRRRRSVSGLITNQSTFTKKLATISGTQQSIKNRLGYSDLIENPKK